MLALPKSNGVGWVKVDTMDAETFELRLTRGRELNSLCCSFEDVVEMKAEWVRLIGKP